MRPQPKGVVCGHAHRLGGSDALRRLSSEPVLSEHPWVFKLCTPPLSTKTKSVATSQDVTLGLASQIAGHRSPRVGGTVRCLVAEPYLYLLFGWLSINRCICARQTPVGVCVFAPVSCVRVWALRCMKAVCKCCKRMKGQVCRHACMPSIQC